MSYHKNTKKKRKEKEMKIQKYEENWDKIFINNKFSVRYMIFDGRTYMIHECFVLLGVVHKETGRKL